MPLAASRGAFRVGPWLVEPGLNRVALAREVRHLRPRVMDLLVYLADHAGEVVTKDRILEDVWQQRFAADSVLSRSVADLRRLLDDDVRQPRVIETIPKRGYRLVATVTPAPPPPARTGSGAGASLVVLPFLDLSADREQEYFCDGLTEEVTARLGQLHELRVVARTSAFAFKGRAADVREIGRRLDVRAALEGSVQRSGDRLRVTVQLVDTADGCHVWSDRFDRPARDAFALEDEIAQSVAAELRVRLAAAAPLAARRGTRSAAAHDLYLRGRHASARRGAADLEQAILWFERALAIDPGYAAAHAGIAECCCVMGFIGLRRPLEVFPRVRREAERALALDPDLAEAEAVLAHEAGMHEWDWEAAERHFVRALHRNPGYASARLWYSHLLTARSRFEEAMAQAERACECDPLNPAARATLGLSAFYARQFDRAEETHRGVLATDPSFGLNRYFLGRLLRARGRFREAVEQLRTVSGALPHALGCLAGCLRSLGREEDARRACAELERLARAQYVSPLAFAASAHIPDHETRLAWIGRAFDEREGIVPLLSVDPMLDDLRSHPTFRAMIDRLGLERIQARRA